MEPENNKQINQDSILSEEQEAILDLYIESLDNFFEEVKQSELTQVEIETLHLKRLLAT
jgi:hypothetical protein